jgi:hypothetical protein
VTVRDPFISRFNWAAEYKDKSKVEKLVEAIWAIYEKAAKAEDLKKAIFVEALAVSD